MSAYDMEIEWAVDKQIGSLRRVLRENDEPVSRPGIVRSGIASAPCDDSLFDSLTMFIKIDEDGTSHLQAVMTTFHLPEDESHLYEIKTLPTFDELKEWVLTTKNLCKICTDII